MRIGPQWGIPWKYVLADDMSRWVVQWVLQATASDALQWPPIPVVVIEEDLEASNVVE